VPETVRVTFAGLGHEPGRRALHRRERDLVRERRARGDRSVNGRLAGSPRTQARCTAAGAARGVASDTARSGLRRPLVAPLKAAQPLAVPGRPLMKSSRMQDETSPSWRRAEV